MTALEFVAKFPERDEIMEGLCEDMACPKCGHRDGFYITFTGTARVFDDTSEDIGDHEWDQDSSCICPQCNHGGTVADFTIPELDITIEEQKANKP